MVVEEDELPARMQKFHKEEPLENDVEMEKEQGQGDTSEPSKEEKLQAIEDMPTGPETLIKKRLKRADSDYDLEEKNGCTRTI